MIDTLFALLWTCLHYQKKSNHVKHKLQSQINTMLPGTLWLAFPQWWTTLEAEILSRSTEQGRAQQHKQARQITPDLEGSKGSTALGISQSGY